MNEVTLISLSSVVKKERSDFLFMAMIKSIYLWLLNTDGKISFKPVEIQTSTKDTDKLFQDLVSKTLRCLPKDKEDEYEDRSLAAIYGEESSPVEEQSDLNSDNHFRGNDEGAEEAHLKKLYEVIIAPVSNLIEGPEIIIIPEGPMCLVPYAALQDSNGKYLSEMVQIRLVPSLTSLQLIQDSPVEYHSDTGALIVGDPEVGRVEFDGKIEELKPLPHARTEVEMVQRYVGVPCIVGREATKEVVLKKIQEVSLVHIAAHGNPERGEIALAPNFPTEGIVQKKDFMLTMEDIAKVRIKAKLVVLSCCNSGRGKVMTAEGVVGISRAFLGSGARSVLMTLWPVRDGATKVFMTVFYRNLIREGKNASESLHKAVAKLRESALYKHFKDWAGFVLVGDAVTFHQPLSQPS